MGSKNCRSAADSPLILDAYGRVSQLVDKRMRSVDGQLTDCCVRIEEYGAKVGEVLSDPGRSAWDPKVERPDWNRLMERLESGASNGVCVFDLSRFSRRPVEGERLISVAERGLVVLDSEHEFDLTTPDGKAQFRDQMKMAAYYSDRLSTVTKRGKRLKARRGEPNAHRQRSFGFEADAITVRESEAAIIREVVHRLLEGDGQARPETLDDLAVDLTARGILTTAAPCTEHRTPRNGRCARCGRRKAKGYGDGVWTAVSLKHMLLKPVNAGFVSYKGSIVGRLPGDPILDPDTWDELKALFTSRRRGRPNSETYLCSGIAICGLCRHRLSGMPRNNLKPYPDGGVRRLYYCQKRVGTVTGCGRIGVDQRALDAHVRELVAAILSSPEHAAQIEAAAKVAKAIDDQRLKLETKIAKAEHTANELAARLGRDEISLERYDAAAGPLETRLAGMRAELKELDRQRKAAPGPLSTIAIAASREAWKKRWDAATTDEKRTLLRRALNGRALVVGPVDVHAPRVFDPNRVTIEPWRTVPEK